MGSHNEKQPPKFADQLLQWFCSKDYLEEVLGDLHEYHYRLQESQVRYVKLRYWLAVIKFFNWSTMTGEDRSGGSTNLLSMFKNFTRIFWRNVLKHRLASAINILGLFVGVLSVFFIYMYIYHELSYDRYHPDYKRIYRLVDGIKLDEGFSPGAIVPFGWGDDIQRAFPEVDAMTRVRHSTRFTPTVEYEDKIFNEFGFVFIDSTYFDVFHSYFLARRAGNPLSEPNGIVIDEQIATKYFGDEDPLGKVLTLDQNKKYEVRAVISTPANSSFKFNFALLLNPEHPERFWTHTFFKLKDGLDTKAFEASLESYAKETYSSRSYGSRQSLEPKLQPLADIRLHSELEYEFSQNSSITYIYLFAGVGIMILTIAVMNFVNMTTARAVERAKETNVRKVLGAVRKQLVAQFIIEGLWYAFVAVVLSLLAVVIMLPSFNLWTGKDISMSILWQNYNPLYMFLATVLLGMLASIYPALYLSKASIIPSVKYSGAKSGYTRRGLVIIQFSLSTIMIIGAIIIQKQMHFFQDKELGFNSRSNLVIPLRDPNLQKNHKVFKEELKKHHAINEVSFTQTLPGQRDKMATLVFKEEGKKETTIVPTFLTDHGFLNALEIKILAGRNFDPDIASDQNACLVNKKALELFGWEDAIGKKLEAVDLKLKGKVIGVTENFHYASLHSEVEPLVIYPVEFFPQAFNYILVNFESGTRDEVMAYVQENWTKHASDIPLDYTILGDDWQTLYIDDVNKAQVFGLFAFASVLLSILGLFGLTYFTLDRRSKEVSVRKVLGASISNIFVLVAIDFLKLILLSNLLAWPLAYIASNRWLQEFAYRIDIGLLTFILSSAAVFLIAIATISLQTLKLALINPAERLKYE